ncbi:MAG: efflux RND transporter periplasmic adaptor subunit, partial [Deltaproteobacteria bacterium]|nr:efflux RND transporter periplasmic adaptor subunit [Deltaproteobacteria bacterium]
IDRGEYVDPGKPLLRLVQIDKLKVIAEVPEKDIRFLSVGQSVEIILATINSAEPDSLTGKIDFIAFSANPATRTYRTKINIDNPGNLRPGMIVRARFIRQEMDQVITAPLFAVMDRDGKKLVYVAENGIARMVPVTIGDSIDQRVVIREGLTPGQRLIVKGQQLLVDGVMISAGDQ